MSTGTASTPTAVMQVNLGPVDQIPIGEGRCFLIGRLPIAVFRTRQGALYATQARCTHQGGPLADGLIGGETLVCPLHSYKFDLVTGRPLGHDCKALKTYPVALSPFGELLVTLPERSRVARESASDGRA
jgi:nitrite reductase (NADH) small subunit